MAGLVRIDRSVGANGTNLAPDVLKIGLALVEIGPDQGGIFAPPLSIGGLGEAIKSFQEFQKLRVRDGKVDPTGNTLRRINEILNPGWLPPVPRPAGKGTGIVSTIGTPAEAPGSLMSGCWTPVLNSLITEMVFSWTPLAGKGRVLYFELDDNVVPNWFGVLVPDGLTQFRHVHIFFHPTSNQGGYKDEAYGTKAGWGKLFHYMSDQMSANFCAANSGQVLIMPLMNQAAAADGGVFPQRWESIVGQILGFLASGQSSGHAEAVAVESVVISSFSSGIVYLAMFRKRAIGLSGKLRGVIDFDGIISTERKHSIMLGQSSDYPVMKFHQVPCSVQSIRSLFSQNIFPLPKPRWANFTGFARLPKNPKKELEAIHAWVPNTMMLLAATKCAAP